MSKNKCKIWKINVKIILKKYDEKLVGILKSLNWKNIVKYVFITTFLTKKQ